VLAAQFLEVLAPLFWAVPESLLIRELPQA